MGGSVATTAFELAIYLGFSQIAFVGLDMCYTNDAYHVPGTMYEEHWFSTTKREKTFEMMTFKLLNYADLEKRTGLKGEPVFLDAKFKMFIQWISKRVEQIHNANDTKDSQSITNCTEGGFPIPNLPNQDLSDFLKNKSSVKVKEQRSMNQKLLKLTTGFQNTNLNNLETFKDDLKIVMKEIADYQIVAENASVSAQRLNKRLKLALDKKQGIQQVTKLPEVQYRLE